MSEPDYNLLDEPWIPVLLADRSVEHFGIREVFKRASEISDLACESPTQGIAIQRILLAICYRVIDVPNLEAWKSLWNEGLPEEPIQSYLDRWEDRFFLFGGKYPFMQAPHLRKPRDEISGLEILVQDYPSRSGTQLFTTRTKKGLKCISPAEAAQSLVAIQAFDVGGTHSAAVDDTSVKSGPGTGSVAWCGKLGLVWLKGSNLDETLILNLVSADRSTLKGPASTGSLGACSWETEEVETGVRRDYSKNPDPNGYATSRLLSWHSRRVRLIGDRTGVTGVVLTYGDRVAPQNMQNYEPLSLWEYSRPESKKVPTYMPRRHEIGRAFWRDISAILPFEEMIKGCDKQLQLKYLPSETLQFHDSFDPAGFSKEYPVRIRLEAFGVKYLKGHPGVIEDIYHDQVTLASVLLKEKNEDLHKLVVEQVEVTEEVARKVRELAVNISHASGQSGDKSGDQVIALFFSLVDDPFRRWLTGIDAGSDIRAMRSQWTREIRRIALSLADDLINHTPISAVMGRNIKESNKENPKTFMSVGIAENDFREALNKIAPIPSEDQKGEQG